MERKGWLAPILTITPMGKTVRRSPKALPKRTEEV